MRSLPIPELSVVVLVGVSGSGKTSFARRHFGRYEVLSSDFCRGLVADDENDQNATKAAFEVLHYIAGKRLSAGRIVVVDATNTQPEARRSLVELARAHDVLPVAIVLDVPEQLAVQRNRERQDRDFGPEVVRRQGAELRRSLKSLQREGFRKVHVLRGVEQIDSARIVREKLLNDFRDQRGPFDVIGDVHGCLGELVSLLGALGYRVHRDDAGRPVDADHPQGRRVIFLGDLADRGPDSPGVLRLAMGMTAAGHAYAVPGNHENKLVRALSGWQVQLTHGLAETMDQLSTQSEEFREQVRIWCHDLVSHLVLDDGRLVVAHAGLKQAYHGRASGRVRSFALYGDTTGETDEYGLPVRFPWAQEYRGTAMVLYGHTPTTELRWVNNTLCLDTGCVFGGALSALRYPERETVQVPAQQVWYQPAKPLLPQGDRRPDDQLDLDDVTGKRVVHTENGPVSVRAENAAGALEVMSRFALAPSWLAYLPPTMSPVQTSTRDGYLEHPAEAFAYYAEALAGAQAPDKRVICQEKHMGSRAVVVLCRDAATAAARFSASQDRTGTIHTRTGRQFLPAEQTERLLARLREAADAAGWWQQLDAHWVILDAELMPWSLKAGELLRGQYAAVGAAARTALPAAVRVLEQAQERGLDVAGLLSRTTDRAANAVAFTEAYRRYCWPVNDLDGVRLAPFQILAAGSRTFHDRDHGWHLELADALAAQAPDLVVPTRRTVLDPGDPAAVEDAVRWWARLTADGGEGMVVKPLANLVRGRKGLLQPGLKVRGREYLRIIYGPDYTSQNNLDRLRHRGLGRKRSLAVREYALGLEALTRLAKGDPLWRVHEAVFAVLALEAEPVDPRL